MRGVLVGEDELRTNEEQKRRIKAARRKARQARKAMKTIARINHESWKQTCPKIGGDATLLVM